MSGGSLMQTDIGRRLQGFSRSIAVGTGFLAVTLDLWLVWLNHYPESIDGRWAVALVAVILYVQLARGDLASLGLVAPSEGWIIWTKRVIFVSIIAGASIAVGLALCLAV